MTSIPNNAVFVYSLDDLKMVGQVALPALKLPGHEAISAVANWVTFTPDVKDDLRVERRLAVGHRNRRRRHEGEGRRSGRRGAEAHQHPGDPRRLER